MTSRLFFLTKKTLTAYKKISNENVFLLTKVPLTFLNCFISISKASQAMHVMEAKNTEVPKLASFDEFNISNEIQNSLKKHGITNLFPIQSSCYKYIFDGQDLIARARTGTGKTLSFGLPMIEKLIQKGHHNNRSPLSIILTPTRELAIQIYQELAKLTKLLKMIPIYGGVPYDPQIKALNSGGAQIIVGTPGRLCDLLEKGYLSLTQVQFLTLDEADRMLDVGFEKELEMIISAVKNVNESVQVSLFSATLPQWIKSSSKKYMKPNYAFVDLVGNSDPQTSETLVHQGIICLQEKFNAYTDLIIRYFEPKRVIVFTQTKMEAAEGSRCIKNSNALHGDVSQAQREKILTEFRQGRIQCLFATDVAARGIDVADVDLVIQHGMPNDPESYVHRSGRSGRAGKEGKCITLFKNYSEIQQIERFIKQSIQIIALPNPISSITKNLEKLKLQLSETSVPSTGPISTFTTTLIDTFGAENCIKKLLNISLQTNNSTLWYSVLTGRPEYQTWHSKDMDVGTCVKLFARNKIIATPYETVEDGIVFDLPCNLENSINLLFEEKNCHLELVVDTLPTLKKNSTLNQTSNERNSRGNSQYRSRGSSQYGMRQYDNKSSYQSKNRVSDGYQKKSSRFSEKYSKNSNWIWE